MAKIHALLENDVKIVQGTIKEIAAKTGIAETTLYSFKYHPQKKKVSKRLASVDLGDGEWALYEGEELIAIDTLENIAIMRGVTERTIRFYSYKSNHRRIEKTEEQLRKFNKTLYKVVKLDD